MTAQQRRQPVAVGVAAHAHDARRGIEDLGGTPILHLRQAAARAVLEVELERPRVQGLPFEVAGEVVLVHAEVAAPLAHDQGAPVLRHARSVDRVDDLEGLLDRQARRDVQEGPAGPQRRVRGLQLVAVERQAL